MLDMPRRTHLRGEAWAATARPLLGDSGLEIEKG
jgi:hypothetical protein